MFIRTGIRAQLGPIIICSQSLLLLHSIARKQTDEIVFKSVLLLVLIISFVAALYVFLTLSNGFSGSSFISVGANPLNFILTNLSSFFLAKWLITSGVAINLAATISFIVIIVMQTSFLLPGFILTVKKWWPAGFRSLKPIEVLLIGTVIAGIAGVSLTEAPGGSHYVFLHYSKMAGIILGAWGLRSIFVKNSRSRRELVVVSITTIMLIVVHLSDTAYAAYKLKQNNISRAFNPIQDPYIDHFNEMRKFLSRQNDLDKSIFLYYPELTSFGARFVTTRFGFQELSDKPLLTLYAGWDSHYKATLNKRLCLLNNFIRSTKSGTVQSGVIANLVDTLQKKYEFIFMIVPTGTIVTDMDNFIVRTGPNFAALKIPIASLERNTQPTHNCK